MSVLIWSIDRLLWDNNGNFHFIGSIYTGIFTLWKLNERATTANSHLFGKDSGRMSSVFCCCSMCWLKIENRLNENTRKKSNQENTHTDTTTNFRKSTEYFGTSMWSLKCLLESLVAIVVILSSSVTRWRRYCCFCLSWTQKYGTEYIYIVWHMNVRFWLD